MKQIFKIHVDTYAGGRTNVCRMNNLYLVIFTVESKGKVQLKVDSVTNRTCHC